MFGDYLDLGMFRLVWKTLFFFCFFVFLVFVDFFSWFLWVFDSLGLI